MLGLGRIVDIAAGIIPLDLQTARSGDYVSLKNAKGVTVVFFKGAGTAADDPVLTFRQATAVAGTAVKDLAVITQHWQKQGTLNAVTGWTRVTQSAAAAVTLDGTSAESEGIYVFEIEADQLDVDGGFDCLVLNIADTGTNAQLGCVLYLLRDLAVMATPANLPDPLVD